MGALPISRRQLGATGVLRADGAHDPENWIPVFGLDHARNECPPERNKLGGANAAHFYVQTGLPNRSSKE